MDFQAKILSEDGATIQEEEDLAPQGLGSLSKVTESLPDCQKVIKKGLISLEGLSKTRPSQRTPNSEGSTRERLSKARPKSKSEEELNTAVCVLSDASRYVICFSPSNSSSRVDFEAAFVGG